MSVVVQKYGGSSVADLEHVRRVARVVARRRGDGDEVVVVVSAMGATTDELLAMAKALAPSPPRRELDMLLSAGERISAALLAMALAEEGIEAVSFTGSQCGIITDDRHSDARIIEVRPVRVQDELRRGRVVIVAGFQGMSYRRDITTLGRGGSDTTAVALAAALSAEACEIYSDVDGVLSADPRLVEAARRIDVIGYPEMQELACAGAKVLNPQAVEFAKRAGIALYARRVGEKASGTLVRVDPPPPAGGARGIAHREQMLVFRCAGSRLGQLARGLERHGSSVNFLAWTGAGSRTSSTGTAAGSVEAWCARDNLHGEAELRQDLSRRLDDLEVIEGCGAVSLIGEGIMEDPRHLSGALSALAERGLGARGASTSSFRISLLLERPQVADAVRCLHERFVETEPPAVVTEV